MGGRLSYANVVATLALFVALGGSSYAAVQLSRGAVKSKHLARNSVTSAKVKDRSLRARDFKRGRLPAGRQGPQGPPGALGPKGDVGPPGVQTPPGLTQGSATSSASAMPRPIEDTHLTHSIETRSSGRLFVYGKASLHVSCTGPGSFPQTGLYVDGTPVAGSAVSYPEVTETTVSVAGMTGQLVPGNHAVALGTSCVDGDWERTAKSAESVSAIVLGGS